MRNNIFIRTDGGPKVGYGHIMRCIALAQMIQQAFDVTFICKEVPDEIVKAYGDDYKFKKIQSEQGFFSLLSNRSIVIVDGYAFDQRFYKELKEVSYKTISIQDVENISENIDLVINHLPESEKRYKDVAVLSGPKYAILRQEFLDTPKVNASTNEVLIALGGTTNFVLINKLLDIFQSIAKPFKVHVLTTENNAHEIRKDKAYIHSNKNAKEVVDLIDRCGLCFITSGMISYEVLARNKKAIVGTLNRGQAMVGEKFASLGLVEYVGSWENVTQTVINEAISCKNVNNTSVSSIFDGKSGNRILKEILQL